MNKFVSNYCGNHLNEAKSDIEKAISLHPNTPATYYETQAKILNAMKDSKGADAAQAQAAIIRAKSEGKNRQNNNEDESI